MFTQPERIKISLEELAQKAGYNIEEIELTVKEK